MRVLAWALALVAVTLTAARWVDVTWSPLVLVQSLSPLAGLIAVVALIGVLPGGRASARVALAGACLGVVGVQAAIWMPWISREPAGHGRELTVMTVNLYRGQAHIDAVSRLVRTEGVDLLALSELTPAAEARMRTSDVDDLLPYVVGRTGGASATTALRSRLRMAPLGSSTGVPGPALRSQTARLPGRSDVIVCAVHPTPPVPGRIRRWRTAQDQLSTWAERTGAPIVVAGDLNASVDHPGMRQVLRTGLRDAHEVAGAGRPVTWPNGRTVPPFVQLDHVLVRGVGVESAEDVRIPGSDHDAVIVRLVVPAER